MLVGGWITQILSQWIGDVSGMVYELLQDPPIFLMGKKTGKLPVDVPTNPLIQNIAVATEFLDHDAPQLL